MKLLERLLGNDRERVKKQLLAGQLRQVEIEGVRFYVRRLSAQVIFGLQEQQRNGSLPVEEALYRLVAASVCDREGTPLFTPDEAGGLNVFLLNSLIVEAMDFNGLNPDAVDKARETLKNGQTQGERASTIN